MCPLQLWFLRSFDSRTHHQSKILTLPLPIQTSLIWWTRLLNLLRGVPFLTSPPSMTLTTDASLWGWGAHLEGSCVWGQWPTSLRSKHIDFLELLAILWALQSFQDDVKGRVVQILSDNMTAVHYVNKQGGTVSRSLCHLAFSLWDFCIGLNITPVATNLLGTLNTLADAVSRGGPFPPRTTGGSCLASSSFPVLRNTIGGCVCLCSKQAMPSLLQQRPH